MNECPWCGLGMKTVGQGLSTPLLEGVAEWLCGSSKHGKEPWQSVDCELNVAVQENAKLQAIVGPLNKLWENEGASILFFCDNPDFNEQPDRMIEVTDDWTDWRPVRFGGDTLTEALAKALKARETAKGISLPS